MRGAEFLAAAAVLGLAAQAASAQPLETPRVSCNRQCLLNAADDYLAALVAHDPRRLPWALDRRFVENTVPMQVGRGLWETASGLPGAFAIYVPDETSQQVGFLGVMEEQGAPILLALRLRLDAGRVAEAEHLIVRDLPDENLANLRSPRADLLATVPLSQRVSREAMLEIAGAYYVAVNGNNGSAAPFADECVRHENGLRATGNPPPLPEEPMSLRYFGSLDCDAQLDTRVMSYITAIDGRRVEIADVETGLVFGLSHFRHAMRDRTVDIVGVPGTDTFEVDFEPFDLPAAHVFKISDAEIHEIEAVGFMLPYNSRTGWE